MEHGSSLILSMARVRNGGERAEENIAVGDEVLRGDRVSEDVGRAAVVRVVAFGLGGGAGAAAVVGYGLQASGNLVLGFRGRGLEVGVELGAGGGGFRGGRCLLLAVGESVLDGGELVAGAGGADDGALGDGFGDCGGDDAVDGEGELVGFVVDVSGELGGVGFGVGEETFGEYVEIAAVV